MARTLSPSLAAVVEELEVEQPTVVTADALRAIVTRHRLGTSPKVIAARLRQAGWLLPTERRGVWEFAPGAHAGPIGHGDPTLPLQVALAAHPHLSAALALGTAAWALGCADRVPSTLDVAVPVGTRLRDALTRRMAITTFTTSIGPVRAKGVPCHRPESVLVHLAADPTAPRSWTSVLEWLPDLAAEATCEVFAAELSDRPRSISIRAGYLLSGLRPDLAAPLKTLVGEAVRFGPRSQPLRRHVGSWRILDYLLPSDPTTWEPVG
jgi:AbiEi antitoxin C-terminal domain